MFVVGQGATGLNVTTAGNVGIGIINPGAYMLNVNGNVNVSGTITSTSFSVGSNTGDVTLTAIGATPNANGATLTGQALNLQPANASFGGVVTTGAQTFAGAKTLTSPVIADLNPAADFTLTQNSIKALTSINAGAIVNTLYLKAGNVGIETTSPGVQLQVGDSASAGSEYMAVNTANAQESGMQFMNAGKPSGRYTARLARTT